VRALPVPVLPVPPVPVLPVPVLPVRALFCPAPVLAVAGEPACVPRYLRLLVAGRYSDYRPFTPPIKEKE